MLRICNMILKFVSNKAIIASSILLISQDPVIFASYCQQLFSSFMLVAQNVILYVEVDVEKLAPRFCQILYQTLSA